MTQRCTLEEKQHMIDLIVEIQQLIADLKDIVLLPKSERERIVLRIREISDEMKQFRKRYPLD